MALSKKNKKEMEEMNEEQIYNAALVNVEIAHILPDAELAMKSYKKAIDYMRKIVSDFEKGSLLYKKEKSIDGRILTEEEKSLVAADVAVVKIKEIKKEYHLYTAAYLIDEYGRIVDNCEKAQTIEECEAVIQQLTKFKYIKDTYLPSQYEVTDEDWAKIEKNLKDMPKITAKCKEKSSKNKKHSKKVQLIGIGLLFLLVIGVVLSFRTPYPYIIKAKAEAFVGINGKARHDYKKLEEKFGNPEYHEQYLYYTYKDGLNYLESEDYKGAYDIMIVAAKDNYKDSVEIVHKIEMQSILNREIGDSAHFGDYIWYIVDRTDTEATLVARTPIETDVVFSKEGKVWEDSELHEYLNSDFYENTFSEIEKADILLTSVAAEGNTEYGIPAGKDTEDYVYLLSSEEVNKYSETLQKIDASYWLRTPGSEKDLNAFAIGATPMMYGYLSSDTSVGVCPVIRISLVNE